MSERGAFPIIVGCGRSGTTLLRVLLDSHPELAIPDESNVLPVLARRREVYERPDGFARDRFVEHLFTERSIRRWGIVEDDLLEVFEADPPRDLVGAIRCVYDAYARLRGKPRAGDKTPRYVLELPLLADLLPEARFVHVIRDGRDVALSYLDVDFGPRSVGEAAVSWQERVDAGRRTGEVLGAERYVEVRYEDLLADVEGVVRSLCDWLDLRFEPAMLRYHEREDLAATGAMWKYRNVTRPPTPGLRDWRTQMDRRDLERFEALAGPTLQAAGYERAVPSPRVSARARASGDRVAARVQARLRSWRRSLRAGPSRTPARSDPFVSELGEEPMAARSLLLARQAEEDPAVRAFRDEVLSDALLRLEEVPGWMASMAMAGEPTGALDYVGPDGGARRPISAAGDLERLRELAVVVAARAGWSPGEAATFVLTGLAPRVEAIRSSVTGGYPTGANTRVVLEVDPATDPREVLRRYRRLRGRLVPPRPWTPDARSLSLAAFWAEHREAEMDGLFETWNRTHPTMSFHDRHRFERELTLARRRLLDPPW